MTLMRLVHAFEYSRPAETRTRGLWQCPRCKDVVEAWSGCEHFPPICSKCSDEEIPTNRRMTL